MLDYRCFRSVKNIKLDQMINYVTRCLQFQEQNLSHDFLQSISKVDKQHFFLWTFPMYPTSHCHDLDSYLHKRGLPQTTLFVLFVGSFHSGWVFCLNQNSGQDPLQIISKGEDTSTCKHNNPPICNKNYLIMHKYNVCEFLINWHFC